MAKRTTKRKRRLKLAIILSAISLICVLLVIVVLKSQNETYVPGDEIEGLTSELDRTLPGDHPKVSFVEVNKEANINFRHFGTKRTTQLPEDMGSGVAWGDFDNDGWEDIFIANFSGALPPSSESPNVPQQKGSQLYYNNGDGTFNEVAAALKLEIKDYVNAGAWIDFDNDGWQDLFLSCYGRVYLFRNIAGKSFKDYTAQAGLSDYQGYWAGLAVGDYNLDGNVDIYVCGYVDYQYSENLGGSLQYNAEVPASINPSSFQPIKNLLFRNNGDGTFSEKAAEAGVSNANGRSLEAAWCDFDDDGFLDLYVANDVSDNALYRNNGDGSFTDISYNSFVADYRGAMGIGTGDWDKDGDFDMFITHWMAQENALYNNLLSQISADGVVPENRIKFMDQADRFGLGQIALSNIGFATFFFDFDNDSRLDLFVSNGSTFQERDNSELLIGMQDQLLWNRNNDEGFFDVSAVSGAYFKKSFVGRGAAYADYDQDGDLDIMLNNNDGSAKLLKNEGGNNSNWLQVKLLQENANIYALGAKVKVVNGTDSQIRQVGSQGPYFSQNTLIQHFGLGNRILVDSLIIGWPDGTKEVFQSVPANQLLIIEKDKTIL